MKDKNIFQSLQNKKDELDKSRGILQNQLEQKLDDKSISQTLSRICALDKQRFLLFKISKGALS